jgi:DNA-directed RNA polymerase alpha subunit
MLHNNADNSGKENLSEGKTKGFPFQNPFLCGISISDRAKASLDKPVAELELSLRCASVLEAVGITTVKKLVNHTETDMLKYRNFGRKSLNEIKQKLSEMDLRLGMKLAE